MFNRFLFCLFLLPISTINTAEITPHNPIETLSDDLIIYNISTRLDRIERNNFRHTNKKHSQLVLSQAQINANYARACIGNDINVMLEWRKQGALEPFEEICNLATDKRSDEQHNRNIVAKKLLLNHPNPKTTTLDILSYGIRQNNCPFISWILTFLNPEYDSQEIRSSLKLAQELKHHIINIRLLNYVSEKEAAEKKAQKNTQYYDDWCP
jgi:hypothetical protein